MFDRLTPREKQLIEERKIYENAFIDVEAIEKSRELDFYTTPQYSEYFDERPEDDLPLMEEDLALELECERYLIERDCDYLIEERLAEEREFFEMTGGSLDEPLHFDDEGECCVEDLGRIEGAYCGSEMRGYTIDDDDRLGYCDYP